MVWCLHCAKHITRPNHEQGIICCSFCGRVLDEDSFGQMDPNFAEIGDKEKYGSYYFSKYNFSITRMNRDVRIRVRGHCRTMIFDDTYYPLFNANPIRWNRSIQANDPEAAEEQEIPDGVANGTSSRSSSSRVNTDDETSLSEIKFPISSVPSEVSTSVDRKRKMAEFVTRTRQQKRKKTTEDKILKCLERILDIMQRETTVSSRTFGEGVQFSIRDCLNALVRIPQIKEGDALFLYATRLFLKPDIRELFICLDKDEIRLKWLQDELNRDEQNKAFSFDSIHA